MREYFVDKYLSINFVLYNKNMWGCYGHHNTP